MEIQKKLSRLSPRSRNFSKLTRTTSQRWQFELGMRNSEVTSKRPLALMVKSCSASLILRQRKSIWQSCIWKIPLPWIKRTISLSKHGKLCRMIQNWHEYLAKLPFKKRNTAVLFNCCKKAAARIRWTRRASTTWACLIWSLSKSPKPHRTWNARWQLGFRSRLLRTPGGCSLKQKLNDEDDHGLHGWVRIKRRRREGFCLLVFRIREIRVIRG